jgi:hypothetical protein
VKKNDADRPAPMERELRRARSPKGLGQDKGKSTGLLFP